MKWKRGQKSDKVKKYSEQAFPTSPVVVVEELEKSPDLFIVLS